MEETEGAVALVQTPVREKADGFLLDNVESDSLFVITNNLQGIFCFDGILMVIFSHRYCSTPTSMFCLYRTLRFTERLLIGFGPYL